MTVTPTDEPGVFLVSSDTDDLPWKVDIVDWATTGEHFRRIIESNKAILQTAKPRKVSDQGLDTL